MERSQLTGLRQGFVGAVRGVQLDVAWASIQGLGPA